MMYEENSNGYNNNVFSSIEWNDAYLIERCCAVAGKSQTWRSILRNHITISRVILWYDATTPRSCSCRKFNNNQVNCDMIDVFL
jgi:hypothetical protein